MSSKTWLVAQRELMENMRTKAFWIGILILPFIFVFASALAVVFAKAQRARSHAVIDESGWLVQAVDQRARQRDVARVLRLARSKAKAGEAATLPAALQPVADAAKDASNEQIDAAARLVVPVETQASTDVEVPDALRAIVASEGRALLDWLDALSTEEARQVDDQLSKARFERRPAPAASGEEAEKELAAAIDKGSLFAYFVIGSDPVGNPDGNKYVSNNATDDSLRNWFSSLADDEVQARRFLAEGIQPDVAQRIQARFWFQEKQVSKAGAVEEVKVSDKLRQFAPMGFCYFLWIAVLVSASMLVTNTIEEKSNRVIEVLLSSVSPLQLMTGKILGIALSGLCVVGSWILFFVGGTLALAALAPLPPDLDLRALVSDPLLFVSFVVYFILGYLLYAAILVALGSVCNSLKEAQNLMAPINILMIVPMVAIPIVARDPNGTVAQVLSFIPFFTPFVMMNRAAGPPAIWEYVATTALLIGSVVVAFWLAAKIFRVGILMTGKPPKLSELWHWVRQPVGVQPERDA